MRDPAFLFYPESFLVGVMFMDDEEVGQYIRLMCLQHQKGHIPERMMEKVSDAVKAKFKVDANGRYYNERLEAEMEKRAKFVESRQANGNLGGRPRKTDKDGTVKDWAEELLDPTIVEAFCEFADMRAELGKPITNKGTVRRLAEKLNSIDKRADKQKAIIEQSVDNGWKNFYALPVTEKREYMQTYHEEEVVDAVEMPDEIRVKIEEVFK